MGNQRKELRKKLVNGLRFKYIARNQFKIHAVANFEGFSSLLYMRGRFVMRTTWWIICLGLVVLACAGPQAAQQTRTVSVAVPEPHPSEPELKSGPVLNMDRISLSDSLLFVRDPLQTLEDIRNHYDIALAAAKKQDLATAQTAIDEALRRLVALSDQQQSWVVAGRKDLLRDLSRLVINMHEGRPLAESETRGNVTRDYNSRVTKQVNWWLRYSQDALKLSYARSGLYGNLIRNELAARGMPQELQWLPAVESNFKPRAYSWADAAGMWQFIMDTGKRYGLNRSGFVDDRMDPYKATGAALDYLGDLYDMLGDWHLALAAYNCGESRVLRAVNRQGTSDFWRLSLPRETLRYVPRFLAAVYLFENPEQYNVTFPDLEPAFVFEETMIHKSVALVDVAESLEIAPEQLKEMNPGIRYGVTPPEGYPIRVPLGLGETLLAAADEMPEAKFTPPPETLKYRVRRGDTLGHIALRYRTSVRKLKSMNRLRSDRIRIGRVLKVPGKRYNNTVYASTQRSSTAATTVAQTAPSSRITGSYTIRRGDTLSRLASRFGTTVSMLRQLNGLRNDHLSVGQLVKIPADEPKTLAVASSTKASPSLSTRTYKVRRGDTLSEIARRYGTSLFAIYYANPSVSARRLKIGQMLAIPGAQVRMAVVETTHIVKRGESLWTISRRYGQSLASILKLNDLRQGDIIKPGQILRVVSQ